MQTAKVIDGKRSKINAETNRNWLEKILLFERPFFFQYFARIIAIDLCVIEAALRVGAV